MKREISRLSTSFCSDRLRSNGHRLPHPIYFPIPTNSILEEALLQPTAENVKRPSTTAILAVHQRPKHLLVAYMDSRLDGKIFIASRFGGRRVVETSPRRKGVVKSTIS